MFTSYLYCINRLDLTPRNIREITNVLRVDRQGFVVQFMLLLFWECYRSGVGLTRDKILRGPETMLRKGDSFFRERMEQSKLFEDSLPRTKCGRLWCSSACSYCAKVSHTKGLTGLKDVKEVMGLNECVNKEIVSGYRHASFFSKNTECGVDREYILDKLLALVESMTHTIATLNRNRKFLQVCRGQLCQGERFDKYDSDSIAYNIQQIVRMDALQQKREQEEAERKEREKKEEAERKEREKREEAKLQREREAERKRVLREERKRAKLEDARRRKEERQKLETILKQLRQQRQRRSPQRRQRQKR